MDTIFACASGMGRSGVCVIRISGPEALPILHKITNKKSPFTARQACLAKIFDPVSRETIDHALVLFFENPASFTGEDVVELHLHGSPAILAKMTEVLSKLCRLAEPGEFTRRAFENDKMDLTAAEGLADLIDAETELQRRQALRQMEGGLAKKLESWRADLMKSLAHLEAYIDFPDEDLPEVLDKEIEDKATNLMGQIKDHLASGLKSQRLRDGVLVSIIGPPNAGKSSLLNLLADREAAIVSDQAGTTRDIVEVRLDLFGFPVILADTAGIRNATDKIEEEGIKRAKQVLDQSDLTLLMYDASEEFPDDFPEIDAARTLLIANKLDLSAKKPATEDKIYGMIPAPLSVKTGDGVEEFLGVLKDKVQEICGLSESATVTRQRHRQGLEECAKALDAALKADLIELRAESLRQAMTAIGRLTGRVDVEELLDMIFSDFCIGK